MGEWSDWCEMREAPRDRASREEAIGFQPWDEVLRGPQMASPTGRTIFKYQMPVAEQFTLTLPGDPEFLRVADQDGMFWLWALVDLRQPPKQHHFRAFKTGAPIPDGLVLAYIGFCAIHIQQELGLYIFLDFSA